MMLATRSFQPRAGVLRAHPLALWVLLAAILVHAAPAGAQPANSEFQKLDQQAGQAYAARDFPKYEELLRAQIKLQPINFVPRYNLACALCLQGKSDEAMAALVDAIEHGFVDRRELKYDPSLAPLRARDDFKALLTNWPKVLDRHRDAVLAAAQVQFKPGYTVATDEHLRLNYLSAFDPKSFEQARAEVTRLGEWAQKNVFPDIFDDKLTPSDPWVLVILPNRKDFLAWAVANFGPAALGTNSAIGGSYSHDQKRLVTQDLGSGLRHEFFHVLHWRDNARHAQTHAIWVQEGLCSLVEDYDRDPSGNLVPTVSWRTNIAKRLEKNGLLIPIEKFCALSRTQFMAARPLAMYAHARTLFLFLYQRGKLAEWYRAYVDTFDQDPSGMEAWKRTFPIPIADLNKEYRAWVRALPSVPEEIEHGKASLGVEVEAGSGDGPVIVEVSAAARRTNPGLVRGDIITAINTRPTRDLAELVRVLSDYAPGDKVEIAYRRAKGHATTTVTLVAQP